MRLLYAYLLMFLLIGMPIAASNDAGTESPFSFGAGARDLSMGGANVSGSDVSTAVYWNPSGLARLEQYSFTGFYSRLYESNVNYQFIGLSLPTIDYGAFGVGIFRLGISGIEKRDAGDMYLGEFQDNHLAVYFGYARTISSYDLGISLNVEYKSIDNISTTSSPGLNLSFSRIFNIDKTRLNSLAVGLQVRNIIKPGLKLLDDRITYPTTFEGGISIGITPLPNMNHVLILSSALVKPDQVDPEFRSGIEYKIENLIAFRGGLRSGNLATGVGILYKSIAFDYALVGRDLGSLHLFSLTSSLGKPLSQKRNERRQRREAEFNQLMQDRLTAQNLDKISKLMEYGENHIAAGEWSQAIERFERALFLARGTGFDTTQIAISLAEASNRLDHQSREIKHEAYCDSAQFYFECDDYLTARRFAGMAGDELAGSERAHELLEKIDSKIRQIESREDMIQEQLQIADSLITYERIDASIRILVSLQQFAPDNPDVRAHLRKAMFERWRGQASRLYSQGALARAQSALDSALNLFPGHGWCLEMKDRIKAEAALSQKVETAPAIATKPLSAEMQKEVSTAYFSGQKHFKEGRLLEAISQWERVETLAPNYSSVRNYLVNAYKFVGVERYSQNQFEEAVEIWKKAISLDPGNDEILEYISRTQVEIRKLRELSYGKQ